MKTSPTDRDSTNVEDRSDGKRRFLKQAGVGMAYLGVAVVSEVKKTARRAEEGFGLTGDAIAAKKARREASREAIMRQGLAEVGAAIKGKPIPSSGLFEKTASKGPPKAWEYVAYGALGAVVSPLALAYGIGKAIVAPGPSDKEFRKSGRGAWQRFHQGQAAAAQVGKNMPARSAAHLTTSQARQFATANEAYRGMQSAKGPQRAGDTFDRTYTQGPKAGVTEKVRNTRKGGG